MIDAKRLRHARKMSADGGALHDIRVSGDESAIDDFKTANFGAEARQTQRSMKMY